MTDVTNTAEDTTKELPPGNAPEHGSAEKILDYAKSRFNKDNWFGSLLLPFMFHNGYQTRMAAKNRIVDGQLKIDYERKLGAELFMAEKTWSFFSTRGGTFPEGKNVAVRVLNAFKHPLASSTQFEWLMLVPSKVLSIYANCSMGLKAYGVTLANGEQSYKAERSRLYNGLAQIGSFAFTAYGHFRDHAKDKAKKQATENSPAPSQTTQDDAAKHAPAKTDSNIFHMTSKVWKHDRSLIIGSIISTLIPMITFVEGLAKIRNSRTEAKWLMENGISQSLVNVAYTIYTIQRVAKGNYHTDNTSINVISSPEIEQIEEQAGVIKKPADEKKFAARFPQASVRNAGFTSMVGAA